MSIKNNQGSDNIPQLRFPEFEVEWEKKKLENIAEVKTGPFGSSLHQHDYVEIGTPIITVEHLDELGIVHKNLPLVSDEDKSRLKSYHLKTGDLVFSRVGSVDRCSLISERENGWLFSGRLLRVRFQNQIPAFFNYQFQLETSKQKVRSIAVGQTMPSINTEILKSIELTIATLPEQTKIATFLTAVDEKIQALKKKHSLLEQYKKGVMQKLFCLHHDSVDLHDDPDSQGEQQEKNQGNQENHKKSRFRQLRFKDKNGNDFPEWEVKKLGELGVTYGGLSGKSKENFGKGKTYIQYKQIFDDSKIDISRFELVEIDEDENQNKVHFGDVFFTVSSETPDEIGMSSVLLDKVEDLYLNSFCFGFRANSLEELNPFFSRYLFRSESFREEIIKLAQGSTRYNMSKTQLLKIEIQLPCLKEQTAIANFLSALDEKINQTQTQIDKMEVWKKGLLQKMFC